MAEKTKLKEFRLNFGYSRNELAEKLGITAAHIRSIETHRRSPGFRLSMKIAELFDTTIEDLFYKNCKEKMIG